VFEGVALPEVMRIAPMPPSAVALLTRQAAAFSALRAPLGGAAADSGARSRQVNDELRGDVHALRLRCLVNGEVLQEGNTAQLVHNVPKCIAWISKLVTLKPGDVMRLGIQGLGEQTQSVHAWDPAILDA
jgi:hypothetical protein